MKSKLLILGLGLIAMALVVALALSWLQPQSVLENTYTGSELSSIFEKGQSAREAYAKVEAWAASWADDAQVVAASTVFERHSESHSGWTFQLYSRDRGQLAIIMVSEAETRVINKQAALYPQNGVTDDSWSIDSDAALTSWWDERGSSLWQQPGARSLTLHLGRSSDGRVTWQLVLLDEDQQVMDFWQIDAGTGDRLADPTRGEE